MAVVAPHSDGKQYVADVLRQLANEIEAGTIDPIRVSQQADIERVSGWCWEESRCTGQQSLQLDYYKRTDAPPVPKALQEAETTEDVGTRSAKVPLALLFDCLRLLTAYQHRCAELVDLGLRGFPATEEVDAMIERLREGAK